MAGPNRGERSPRITAIEIFLYRRESPESLPEYLLLRRHSGLWQPVSGKIEARETPLMAAWREAREETGLDPSRVLPAHWSDMFVDPERGNLYLLPVFVGEAPAEATVRLGTEHTEFAWLRLEDALARLTYHGYREALKAADAMRVSEGIHHRPRHLAQAIGAEPRGGGLPAEGSDGQRRRRRRRRRRGRGGPPGDSPPPSGGEGG